MGSGLEYFTFKELDAYRKFAKKYKENKLTNEEKQLVPFLIKDRWNPQLANCYGVNLGCLMVRKEVVEAVPFRTHKSFLFGEDLWYFSEANDKHFKFWVDTNIRAIHKNTEWNSVVKKGPQGTGLPGFSIAMGPADADKIVFLERGRKRKKK